MSSVSHFQKGMRIRGRDRYSGRGVIVRVELARSTKTAIATRGRDEGCLR